MVKHIVFWKLKTELMGTARDAALRQIKTGFEALPGKIPGLLAIEIGFNYGEGTDTSDMALYAEFDSRASLVAYQSHPEHLALAPLVTDVRTEKRVIDYEV